jgi:hypothetical protein
MSTLTPSAQYTPRSVFPRRLTPTRSDSQYQLISVVLGSLDPAAFGDERFKNEIVGSEVGDAKRGFKTKHDLRASSERRNRMRRQN